MFRKFPCPSGEQIETGSQFVFQINPKTRGHSGGDILDVEGKRLWRYERGLIRPRISRENPFRTRDCIFRDVEDEVVCTIRRTSFRPSLFTIFIDGEPVGQLTPPNIFCIHCKFTLRSAAPWAFRLHRYSMFFSGGPVDDPQVWVRLGSSKMEWIVLIKEGVETTPLMLALAFIHNRWWNTC